MPKLRAWVRKHLGFRSSREKQSTDHPLFLSSSRRPITPTTFDPPTCLFFQLPYDIRSLIIFMAFGGRTFHVDVVDQEGTWQWRSCVCFRNFPENLPSARYGWLGPWCDGCTEDMGRDARTLRISNGYEIGIMGFLLSCRQAYTEGIDVLYSANCISIKTEPLLLHLPRLIPHSRLASITSLEMVVEAHSVKQENGRFSYQLDHLEPFLDNAVTHCRHLRKFLVSFIVWQRHGHDLLDGPALPLLDAFWRSTQLRYMRVELPSRDYFAVETVESMITHPLEAPIKEVFGTSRWRSLDGEEPKVHIRSIERYPYPPLKLSALNDGYESKESAGYWLCEGLQWSYNPEYVGCGQPL